MKYVVTIAIVLLAVTPTIAAPYTITFSGLVNANATTMPDPYIENVFSVSTLSSNWSEAHMYGNPVPSIFGGDTAGSVEVTRTNSGPFTFSSVDLAGGIPIPNIGPTATYDLRGFSGATPVFSVSGGVVPVLFGTIPSPSTAPITRLQITLYRAVAMYNIDNIVVNAVPELNSFSLLAIAASCIGLFGKRIYR